MRRTIAALILLAASFGASAELRYIEIENHQHLPMVRVKTLDDFEAIIKTYGISLVFLMNTRNSASDAFVIAGSTYFVFSTEGYRTLSDYRTGKAAKFRTAEDFYRARSLKIEDQEFYYFFAANSFKSVSDCRTARDAGFGDSATFYAARELGFKNPEDYKEHLAYKANGFQSKDEYLKAKSKGFALAREFNAATEAGFETRAEYAKAARLGLKTKAELSEFEEISSSIDKIAASRQLDKRSATTWHFIRTLKKGEMSISVLSKSLATAWGNVSPGVRAAICVHLSGFTSMQGLDESRNKADRELRNGWNLTSERRAELERQRRAVPTNVDGFFTTESLRNFFRTADFSKLGTYSDQTEIFRRK